jgi:nicotinate-nucleotide adenylyltransferase
MANSAQRIGLLGGSFNPAHAGHLHISREALKKLQLDQIWWLVSPQNPLKPAKGMAPYKERFDSALAITKGHGKVHVSNFEATHGLTYTYETLRALKRRYPKTQFVWIMGADNLAGFHRWQHWREIARMMPMAIFDRAPFSHTALRTKAAQALAKLRLPENKISSIIGKPGQWVYMYLLARRHAASSTEIRKQSKA